MGACVVMGACSITLAHISIIILYESLRDPRHRALFEDKAIGGLGDRLIGELVDWLIS